MKEHNQEPAGIVAESQGQCYCLYEACKKSAKLKTVKAKAAQDGRFQKCWSPTGERLVWLLLIHGISLNQLSLITHSSSHATSLGRHPNKTLKAPSHLHFCIASWCRPIDFTIMLFSIQVSKHPHPLSALLAVVQLLGRTHTKITHYYCVNRCN